MTYTATGISILAPFLPSGGLDGLSEVSVDTPEPIGRLAELSNMINDGEGNVRLEYDIPTRGLIGFRSGFLRDTRGTGVLNSVITGFQPMTGHVKASTTGVLVASEPGTAYDYSNAGYAMLGAIVEAVTGQGYYDYVRERVLDPAGMEETGFFRADEVVPNRATGYQKAFTLDGTTFQNTTTWNPQRGGPAGGGYSTAGDLHRFVRALRDGALLRPESVPLLFSAKTDLGAEGYGFGFNVENEPEHIVGHGGAAFGASTNLDVFLDSGYTAVVLSNYGGVVATPVVRHVRQLVDRIQGATE